MRLWKTVTVLATVAVLCPVGCDEEGNEGIYDAGPDSGDTDSGSVENEVVNWVAEPCEPAAVGGEDSCVAISKDDSAFCFVPEGAEGGFCTKDCKPATATVSTDTCEMDGAV